MTRPANAIINNQIISVSVLIIAVNMLCSAFSAAIDSRVAMAGITSRLEFCCIMADKYQESIKLVNVKYEYQYAMYVLFKADERGINLHINGENKCGNVTLMFGAAQNIKRV